MPGYREADGFYASKDRVERDAMRFFDALRFRNISAIPIFGAGGDPLALKRLCKVLSLA
jgi:hypothetical protein